MRIVMISTSIHVPCSLALLAVLDWVWYHIGAKLIQKSSTAQNNSSKLIARYLLGWIEDVFRFSYLNSSWRYLLIKNSGCDRSIVGTERPSRKKPSGSLLALVYCKSPANMAPSS